MTAREIVEATRAALAPVGFMMPSVGISQVPPASEQRSAVQRLEAAGYRNGWANEGVGGKDVFVQIATLLAATEQLTFGTCISPIWARPPMVQHAAASQLVDAFPGRFVLGIGAGYDFMAAMVGGEYGNPVTKVREHVARMTEPTPVIDSPPVNYATIIGANGRKSITQAGEIADGALPVLIPPSYAAEARKILGPDKLLVVGVTTFVNDDEDAAKAAASATIAAVTSVPNSPYVRTIMSCGYTEEERATGADRLVRDLTAFGSGASIAAAAKRYLDAGADQVILMPAAPDFGTGIDQLESVAAAVTAITR